MGMTAICYITAGWEESGGGPWGRGVGVEELRGEVYRAPVVKSAGTWKPTMLGPAKVDRAGMR